MSLNTVSAQKKRDMKQNKNPLLCDTSSGSCDIPSSLNREDDAQIIANHKQPNTKLIYFTDPICSSCWGIEPQLRRLKLEYGEYLEIEYRMGGLLPDWSYHSGGISKPSDVAHHWDEVSIYYDMPIDGDVWLSDPLSSSYPPSIAFKAAQMQDPQKAILFLREIREMVFLKKKNITNLEYLIQAANHVGLNINQFKADYEQNAQALFEQDLAIAKTFSVRGFPTIFITDNAGRVEMVYGSKPYETYEAALLKLLPHASKAKYSHHADSLFAVYPTMTAKEFSVLSNVPRSQAEIKLDELYQQGKLDKLVTKNGSIWIKK